MALPRARATAPLDDGSSGRGLWVVVGAAWRRSVACLPARRSHFRSEFSPLAEGAPSSF